MTITIDCRHIDSSGIGVYLKECLPFLLDSDNTFLLLGSPGRLAPVIGDRKNAEILPCAIKPFSIVDTFFFPRKIKKKINNSDLFYSPYFNVPAGIRAPVYTTIHDIIFPDMPELTSPPGLAARNFFYRRCFRHSRKILTVSNFSKSRIEHYSCGKIPVIVTYSAIRPLIRDFSAIGSTAKENYILFIGNIKKHKGLACLLDAYSMARRDGLKQKLIVVGSSKAFRTKDREFYSRLGAFKDGEVEFLGSVPDEEIPRLLAGAALLVQPSLYEGFGLPPLEAMSCGTMALISDIPVFREIYKGFPVVFFRTGDSSDLKDKLLDLLLDKEPCNITLSEELRKKYTFQKTVNEIFRVFSGAE